MAEAKDRQTMAKEGSPSERKKDAEFKPEAFIDAMREVNDEVSQVEELRSETEKLRENLILNLMSTLRRYDLDLRIPAESLPNNNNDVRALHISGTGIVTYHFLDGTVKSYRLTEHPPSNLLKIISVVIPHLKASLRLKRKEYENTRSILAKIGKTLAVKISRASP